MISPLTKKNGFAGLNPIKFTTYFDSEFRRAREAVGPGSTIPACLFNLQLNNLMLTQIPPRNAVINTISQLQHEWFMT